jgi:hypothetical protein
MNLNKKIMNFERENYEIIVILALKKMRRAKSKF